MAQPQKTPVAIIIGAGDATGGAIATRFALEGLTVVATRRQREALLPLVDTIEDQGGNIHAFGCDARDEDEMVKLFRYTEDQIGEIDAVISNIGANAKKEHGGILNPQHIANQYWQLYRQPRDCWTHELDLRPWVETF
ncbi:MAG: SDR family NAD(P)-dependent oxidoreductase [Ketobacter sp.]|nr:MAG: SDR family NAD(P)-dependent oxidoreductase [Ketobacter sp.]